MENCLVKKLNVAVEADLPYRTAVRYELAAGKAPASDPSGASVVRLVSNGDDHVKTLVPKGDTITVVKNGYLKHPTAVSPTYAEGVPHTMTNESLAVIATDPAKPVEFIVEGYGSYSPGGNGYQYSEIICKDMEKFKYMFNTKYLNLCLAPRDALVDIKELLEDALFDPDGVVSVFAAGGCLKPGTDIKEFAAFTGATTMQLSNSNLVGSIESLVNGFRAAGRVDPITDFIIGGNSSLTYEGSSVYNMWGHYTLSWTSQTISLTLNS